MIYCWSKIYRSKIICAGERARATSAFYSVKLCTFILLNPLSGHHRSCISQNFAFKTYAYPKLWEGGGRLIVWLIRKR